MKTTIIETLVHILGFLLIFHVIDYKRPAEFKYYQLPTGQKLTIILALLIASYLIKY